MYVVVDPALGIITFKTLSMFGVGVMFNFDGVKIKY